jgi:uncharacterized membrane protein
VLGQVLTWWSALYANHAALRTGVEFLHIGGLVVGGGCAIAADLATLRAHPEGATARTVQLRLLDQTHRVVLLGLVALTVSGALLFAADLDTFLTSKIFWLKMVLFMLLLLNGLLVRLGERQVRRDEPGAWRRLRRTARVSLWLWLLTTLVGAALPNIG